MKQNSFFKRTLACTMAFFMAASGMQSLSMITEAAPASSRFQVREKIGPGQNQFALRTITQVVEGHEVETQVNDAGDYEYDETRPYSFSSSVTDAMDSDYIQGSAGTKQISVHKLPGSATGGSVDYVITPNLNVQVNKSENSTVAYKPIRLDSDGKPMMKPDGTYEQETYTTSAGITVTLDPTRIAQTSAIKFKTVIGQYNNAVAFELVGAPTGSWTELYTGASLSASDVKDGKFTLRMQSVKPGFEGNQIKFYVSGVPNPVPPGAEFEISCYLEAVGSVTLTAMTRQKAKNDVVADMRKVNFVGNSFTGLETPYVAFDTRTDSLTSVTNGFKLLNSFYKYNAPMHIDWEVVEPPHDRDGQPLTGTGERPASNYVVIDQQRGQPQISASVRYARTEDTVITLRAKVGVDKPAGAGTEDGTENDGVITTDITIRGTGTLPASKVTTIYKGWYDDAITGQRVKSEPATQFPEIMEVYSGLVPHVADENDRADWGPFKTSVQLSYGTGRGRATHAIIKATGSGQVELLENNQPNGTILNATGKKIENASLGTLEQITNVDFVAKKAGAVTLAIEYYNELGLIASQTMTKNIQIQDHSPNGDASLRALALKGTLLDEQTYMDEHTTPGMTPEQIEEVKKQYAELAKNFNNYYPGGNIAYGFQSATTDYPIVVADSVEKVTLTPSYNYLSDYAAGLARQIVTITAQPNLTGGAIPTVTDGNASIQIPLKRDGVTVITVTSTAENGTKMSYRLSITRSKRSGDATLENITVTKKDKTNVPITPAFDPNKLEYRATVPNSVDTVTVKAIAKDPWAVKPIITVGNADTARKRNLWQRLFENANTLEVPLVYDDTDVNNILAETTVKVTVQAEDPEIPAIQYTLIITREPPDHNTKLSAMSVTRDRDKLEVKLEGTGFSPTVQEYYASVPFSATSLELTLTPESPNAQKIAVDALWDDKDPVFRDYKGAPVIFPFSGVRDLTTDTLEFKIWTIAEDGWGLDDPRREPDSFYTLIVTRTPPNTNSALLSMTVVNAADSVPAGEFSFSPQKLTYDFTVPFTTESVLVTPVPKEKTSTVTVNDKKITENVPGQKVALSSTGVTKILVVVTPESGDADKTTYTLNITRKKPGTEARLKSLVMTGSEGGGFTPKFVPNTTSYSASIADGTKEWSVTPIPEDPAATLTVNGIAVKNGEASQAITSLETNSTITIVVTAEDGKTSKTYTIKVKNYNYITKSTNADLASLKLNPGELAPKFSPSALDYEVYVMPDTMALTVIPKAADSNAKVEVTAGSLKLTKTEDGYTSSLLEDENTFAVKVTAEDGVTIKTYNMTVYKGDEEKQGSMKPLEPDSVDFESAGDQLIIDITKYPVISAEVFNTLKTEYPDKEVIFKGLDYTLKMKGGDMDTLIPNAESYDLRFSFSTPEEAKIQDLLDEERGNRNLEPVYMYFAHHGTLPCPMLLTVSLGKEYSNEKLFWNYFNGERERIDYYGYVNTNAKGTFSVAIDHFSTYLMTDERIAGAENKSGLDYSGEQIVREEENLNGATTTNKRNPNTGAGGAA